MKRILAILLLVAGVLPRGQAVEVSQLSELLGYTMIADTNAVGELNGVDFGTVVKMDNGMIFEFQTYDYFYEVRPEVAVFAKSITLPSGKNFNDYKVLIEDEDEVFDVIRIR